MKILVIEDHPYKLGQVLGFLLSDTYSESSVSVKKFLYQWTSRIN